MSEMALMLRPGTLASGAIIERVRTGTPARWASNHENPLALVKCGGYDSRGMPQILLK